MNNWKTGIMAGIVALAVALGVSFFVGRRPVPPEKPVGAVPGQTLQPDLSIGDVNLRYERQRFTTATTTLCSFRAPRDATSTLESFTVAWNDASGMATSSAAGSGNPLLVIAKDETGGLATTTAIDSVIQLLPNYGPSSDVGVGARFKVINASTTKDGINTNELLSPSTIINVRIANSYAGDYRGFAPNGACTAIFKAL